MLRCCEQWEALLLLLGGEESIESSTIRQFEPTAAEQTRDVYRGNMRSAWHRAWLLCFVPSIGASLLVPLSHPLTRLHWNLALEKSISGCASMNFLSISCFCCSSLVGSPICFWRWSYIIFSTV